MSDRQRRPLRGDLDRSPDGKTLALLIDERGEELWDLLAGRFKTLINAKRVKRSPAANQSQKSRPEFRAHNPQNKPTPTMGKAAGRYTSMKSNESLAAATRCSSAFNRCSIFWIRSSWARTGRT